VLPLMLPCACGSCAAQDGSLKVENGYDGSVMTIPKDSTTYPLHNVASIHNHYDDMVKMEEVNDATILHNLKLRFLSDMVYTNIGTILVSVNPFKWIKNLYSSEVAREHMMTTAGELASPHVFAISGAAFRGMLEGNDQSIIISGESGAGKTEATKQCLHFFVEITRRRSGADGGAASGAASGATAGAGAATAAHGSPSADEDKVLRVNPVLEAFGNAKTIRNNNSSRFGRWMTVHFDDHAMICGSKIDNYLLEKSRVTGPSALERNFHVFYLLLSGTTPAERAALHLTRALDYHYLTAGGVVEVRGAHKPTCPVSQSVSRRCAAPRGFTWPCLYFKTGALACMWLRGPLPPACCVCWHRVHACRSTATLTHPARPKSLRSWWSVPPG
jgi:myosin heavy subunit